MKSIATIVIIYMLAALTWWAVLLMRQNDMVLDLNMKEGVSIPMNEAIAYHSKQKKMIILEGIVIGFSLLVGLGFIFKLFKKEISNLKSQNNFLLSFSHELKSPLTSINLSLETLKKRQLPQATQNEVCEIALQESKRLEGLINSILMVAKIDNFKVSQEKIDLRTIAEEAYTPLKSLNTEENRLNWVWEGESFEINGDKAAIKSILVNLVENALKYGKDKPVTITCKHSEKNIELSIKDQGIGISAQEKSKIFQRFYRVGEEATRTSQGTGLGLYIVKKLVDIHEGTIAVFDNDPVGSIFKVTLPKYQ
jgi:signal transduction histidine kinase